VTSAPNAGADPGEENAVFKRIWGRLRGHFQEYVARYCVLAIAVLTPAAGLLGTLAADIGDETGLGKALLGATSALGTAAAGFKFIQNLGLWQMLDTFGTAPGSAPTATVNRMITPAVGGSAMTPCPPPLVGGDTPESAEYNDIGVDQLIPEDYDSSLLEAKDGQVDTEFDGDDRTTPIGGDDSPEDEPDLIIAEEEDDR